jgi:hypothetical protein
LRLREEEHKNLVLLRFGEEEKNVLLLLSLQMGTVDLSFSNTGFKLLLLCGSERARGRIFFSWNSVEKQELQPNEQQLHGAIAATE